MWMNFMLVSYGIIFVSTPTNITVCVATKGMGNNTLNGSSDFFWITFVLGYSVREAFD
jgi:hypothetical protein